MNHIEVKSLRKSFGDNTVLDDFDFSIENGKFVSLLGVSGSGKSTLLRQMAGLMEADKGSVSKITIDGQDIQSGGNFPADIRQKRAKIGYIFQQFNLVERMTVLDNVLIGTLCDTPKWRTFFRVFTDEQKMRAMMALRRVKMHKYANQRVSTLSGGQKQRVAIARTLMRDVDVIFADEPVASLDPETSRVVLELLHNISRTQNITTVVALHQVDYALQYSDEVVALKQGEVFFRGDKDELSKSQIKELYRIIPEDDDEQTQ